MTKPKLLIESWLPIEAIGAESKRERGASSALPPLYFLHIWWARKPLIVSRASVLAGVLPLWSSNWPKHLISRFPDENTYHNWFSHLCGIRGDPVQGRKLIEWAKIKGIKLESNPYGGAPRAFTVNAASEDLNIMGELTEYIWGERKLNILDPFSGGGSIPFEALRYGFSTIANDLNPVAAIIQRASLEFPVQFGTALAEDIIKWGGIWSEHVKDNLEFLYPKQPNESIFAYLWSRTVACPSTGKPVPLSPNWWLSKDPPVAVKMVAEPWMSEPRFEIVKGEQVQSIEPDIGTISHGVARSPWTGQTISGEYIKSEAQNGRMGQILYSVVLKVTSGVDFRPPSNVDIDAFQHSVDTLDQTRNEWLIKGFLPDEDIGLSNYDRGHRLYGIRKWSDFFSSRQLFANVSILISLRTVQNQLNRQLPKQRAMGIETYLGLILDKCVIYNTLQSRYQPDRGIRSIFDRHNYAFTWSYAEFDASSNLLPWSINQIVDAYKEIAYYLQPSQKSFISVNKKEILDNIKVSKGSASKLDVLQNSIYNITVDPPYYDNVQYAELSDFFYIWLKRSVGHLFPEYFTDELTNKDDEAVANPARFVGMGKKKKEMAKQDYERKMLAAFREMHRVLHPDGCLTVMFTHKKVEAWDTLAMALIDAGFTIQASWPVHTESEHSLHQAKKNAASSTILLVCRKREKSDRDEPVWWDDLQNLVRQTARQKAEQFATQGIHGVDLYLSTFGPTLSIISEHWPVLTSEVDPKTGQSKNLRPETALDLAREEVIRLRKQGLLLGRDIQFDPVTDWYLMAWDAFNAEQFPYDEARKLAIALGVDLDHDLMSIERLAVKKGEFITLQKPIERRKHGMVDEDARSFEHWIDAAHTAMMIYAEDGAGPCEVFLRESGLRRDGTFKALIQALLNAIPRTRIKGKFLRPEAETLENMRLAYFDDIVAPVEEEPKLPEGVQIGLWQGSEKTEDEEGEE